MTKKRNRIFLNEIYFLHIIPPNIAGFERGFPTMNRTNTVHEDTLEDHHVVHNEGTLKDPHEAPHEDSLEDLMTLKRNVMMMNITKLKNLDQIQL